MIDVGHGREEIAAGIRRALAPGFREGLRGLVNPYGDGHAAPRIARVLARSELGPRLVRKRFVDLAVKIAFLASRKGYLKVMGSLIQAAIDRGHEALLLTDPGERKPGEATTPEDLAHWPRAQVLPIQRGASLVPLLTGARAEALVGPSLHFVLDEHGAGGGYPGRAGRRGPAVLRRLHRGGAEQPPGGLPRCSTVTFYADRVRAELALAREPVQGTTSMRSARASGAQRDLRLHHAGPARPGRSRGGRRHLGIGPDKPVVLFMSLKMAVPEPRRRFLWGDGSALTRTAKASPMATRVSSPRSGRATCTGRWPRPSGASVTGRVRP